jgi:hypothetical protein
MTSRLSNQLVLPGLSSRGGPAAAHRQAGDHVGLGPGSASVAQSSVRQERVPTAWVIDEDELADRVARRVVSRLRDGPERNSRQLIDAAEVARILGCARSWVYEHKAELGVVRLGGGSKPRLRFDRGRVGEIAAAAKSSEPVPRSGRASQRRPKRRVPLLEIKGPAP